MKKPYWLRNCCSLEPTREVLTLTVVGDPAKIGPFDISSWGETGEAIKSAFPLTLAPLQEEVRTAVSTDDNRVYYFCLEAHLTRTGYPGCLVMEHLRSSERAPAVVPHTHEES